MPERMISCNGCNAQKVAPNIASKIASVQRRCAELVHVKIVFATPPINLAEAEAAFPLHTSLIMHDLHCCIGLDVVNTVT